MGESTILDFDGIVVVVVEMVVLEFGGIKGTLDEHSSIRVLIDSIEFKHRATEDSSCRFDMTSNILVVSDSIFQNNWKAIFDFESLFT